MAHGHQLLRARPCPFWKERTNDLWETGTGPMSQHLSLRDMPFREEFRIAAQEAFSNSVQSPVKAWNSFLAFVFKTQSG